eukprot:CAMPEP_0173078340 /NCGR_PEP_ID=MMETSP1102-20130122/14041_1 /TAXON_ID=49646 /ORGANISM="Geminigera sp., Strain Caron Lab Isolate" /LENGTH=599 /DNA_ID=CAMNT_0013949555 /DNA_START=249 /DNA_END=2049 /DNA_ORIENTATION=-
MSRVNDLEEAVLSQARTYLRSKGVPPVLERRVLLWLDYDTVLNHNEEEGNAFLKRLPVPLFKEVMQISMGTKLDDVDFFAIRKSDHKLSLMLDCYNRMELRNFDKGTIIAAENMPCTAFHLIEDGDICVEFFKRYSQDHDEKHQVVKKDIKTKGDFLGDWAPLGDSQWVPVPGVLVELPVVQEQVAVHVYVVSARELKAMDFGGTSDPYLTISTGKTAKLQAKTPNLTLSTGKTAKLQAKTAVVKKTLEPEWKQRFEILVTREEIASEMLYVQVYDQDVYGSDDSIGEFSIALASIACDNIPAQPMWHTLHHNTEEGNTGHVCLELSIGTPLPSIISTQITCSTCATCKVLTQQILEDMLTGYPQEVVEEMHNLYHQHLVQRLKDAPERTLQLAQINGDTRNSASQLSRELPTKDQTNAGMQNVGEKSDPSSSNAKAAMQTCIYQEQNDAKLLEMQLGINNLQTVSACLQESMEQIMKQLNLLAILQSSNASETLDDAVNASRNLPHKSFVPIAGPEQREINGAINEGTSKSESRLGVGRNEVLSMARAPPANVLLDEGSVCVLQSGSDVPDLGVDDMMAAVDNLSDMDTGELDVDDKV